MLFRSHGIRSSKKQRNIISYSRNIKGGEYPEYEIGTCYLLNTKGHVVCYRDYTRVDDKEYCWAEEYDRTGKSVDSFNQCIRFYLAKMLIVSILQLLLKMCGLTLLVTSSMLIS